MKFALDRIISLWDRARRCIWRSNKLKYVLRFFLWVGVVLICCETVQVISFLVGDFFLFGFSQAMSLLWLFFAILIAGALWRSLRRLEDEGEIIEDLSFGDVDGLEMISDAPVAEDSVDRLPFARTVVEAIKGTIGKPEAEYIGIFGEWGSGKTSVYRIARRICEDNKVPIEFIDFNPWRFSGNASLAEELCAALSKVPQLSRRIKSDFTLAGWKLSNSGMRQLVGSLVQNDGLLSSIFSIFNSDESIKERLNRYLASLLGKKRFVIVIDDVDRLSSEEIANLIKLIKVNGDWKNVTYMLLADREYMAAALEGYVPSKCHGGQAGLAYLEKIIPVALDIPNIPQKRLSDICLDLITKELDARNIAGVDISGDAWEIVGRYMTSLRSVKRYVNTVRSQLYYITLDAEGRISIDVGDFLALTAIRLFAPDFYKAIYENRGLLVEAMSKVPFKKRRLLTKAAMKSLLCPDVDENEWNIRFAFIKECLSWGINADASQKEQLFTYLPQENELLSLSSNFRLGSPCCFEHYFTGRTEDDLAITQGELDALSVCYPSVNKVEQYFVEMHGKNRLLGLLKSLYAREFDEKQNAKEAFLTALARIADAPLRMDGESASPVWNGLEESELHDWMWILFSHILGKLIADKRDRVRFVLKIAQDDACVFVTAKLIEEGANILTDECIQNLKRTYVGNALKMMSSGVFWRHPRIVKMYHIFKISISSHPEKAKLMDVYSTCIRDNMMIYPNITFAMASFVNYIDEFPYNTIPAYYVNFEEAKVFFNLHDVYKTLGDAERKRFLTASWLCAYKCFEYVDNNPAALDSMTGEEILMEVLRNAETTRLIQERQSHRELERGVKFSK